MVRRTKEEAQATRELILDTAEQCFLAQGVSRTSLQDIAQAAGLTRGAIYWHFEGKADLFNALLTRVTMPLDREIRASGEPGHDDPLGRIRAAFLGALKVTATDPLARRTFEIALFKVEYVEETAGVRERRVAGLAERLRQVEHGLRQAARLGQIDAGVPARAAAIGLHALVDGLMANWMLDNEAFDLVRVGTQAVDRYLQGLKSPLSAGGRPPSVPSPVPPPA
ncbi:DNA-binding transcriptional repressor [Rubrivivax sp. A210]|uniref:TetR family transcriptional regulator n=1 Tax=Rubrivivax sp. A210 TaxID=2772301 RepID=UPI00191986FF|nr:TetR family transcriptional regulator [Rubrivivax sp. A210]CAD5374558.1 DNA-binding transcriptional repressor [Rubrivivax sp. A210]